MTEQELNRRAEDQPRAKNMQSFRTIMEGLILALVFYVASNVQTQRDDITTIKANSENSKIILQTIPGIEARLIRVETGHEDTRRRVDNLEKMQEIR